MFGTQDVVIAAGVESMSRVPVGSPLLIEQGKDPLGPRIKERYGVDSFSQFVGAEMKILERMVAHEITVK